MVPAIDNSLQDHKEGEVKLIQLFAFKLEEKKTYRLCAKMPNLEGHPGKDHIDYCKWQKYITFTYLTVVVSDLCNAVGQKRLIAANSRRENVWDAWSIENGLMPSHRNILFAATELLYDG